MVPLVYAPIDLLKDRDLTAAAKVVWLFISYEWRQSRRSRVPANYLSTSQAWTGYLATKTGLGRTTAREALITIARTDWSERMNAGLLPSRRSTQAGRVPIPVNLLTDGSISARARMLYGELAHLAAGGESAGWTYEALADRLGFDPRTLKRRMHELQSAGWVEVVRASRRAHMHFRLRNPLEIEAEREVALAKRRIARASFRGEAIMREYLSLIVDSDEFEDDAAPGFLVNPLTNERLQFDRFYPNASPQPVAFEFNGPQHYGPTDRYSAEESTMQQARDLMKAGICALRGIALVIVHPEDLSYNGMVAKVGNLLPQRKLPVRTPLVDYLESVAASYRRSARRGYGIPEWSSRE